MIGAIEKQLLFLNGLSWGGLYQHARLDGLTSASELGRAFSEK